MKRRIILGGVTLIIFGAFFALAQLSAAVPSQTINYLNKQAKNSAWTVMALKASGQSVNANSISVDNLNKATDIERTILGVVAGGANPINFKNRDLVATLDQTRTSNQIGSTSLLNDDAWGILAYYAAGYRSDDHRIRESKDYLLKHQNGDGGWGYAPSVDSDSNDTAIVIIALIRAGMNKNSSQVQNGLSYLRTTQRSDGGFGISSNIASDSASTAWIISALQAVSIDPNSWKAGSKTPFNFLATTQLGDGSYKWKPNDATSSPIMTAYVAIALSGRSYPVASQGSIFQNNTTTTNTTTNTNNNTSVTVINNNVSFNGDVRFRFEGKDGQFCQGYSNSSTALQLVKDASRLCDFSYVIENTSFGPYVKKIGRDEAEGVSGWLYLVNWKQPSVGANDYHLRNNDYVTWYYGEFDWLPLRITIKDQRTVSNGATLTVLVEEYDNGSWRVASGSQVWVNSRVHNVNSAGETNIRLDSGFYTLKATKADRVRSQSETLLIGDGLNRKVSLDTTIKLPTKPVQVIALSAPEISFRVVPQSSANQVRFGQLEPGRTAQQNVQLINSGDVDLTFTSTVTGDPIFVNYLQLDNNHWQRFSKNINANRQSSVNISLPVPSKYHNAGRKRGELIFWARP